MLRRISRLTGLSLRRMQDWRSLARALACAVLSGCAAWIFVDRALPASGAFARAAIGGAVLLTAYAILNLRRK
jgi:hypothetical protein